MDPRPTRDRPPRPPARALALALALAAALSAPLPTAAQQGAWSVEWRGGISVPEGDLADWTDRGENWALGLTHRIHPRLSLRADGAWTILDPSGTTGPGDPAEGGHVNLYTYTVGVELELTQPRSRVTDGNLWEVALNAGVGGASWKVALDEFEQGAFNNSDTPGDSVSSASSLAVTGGLKVGYEAAEWLTVFAQNQGYIMLGDAADPTDFLGKELVMAHGLGVRLTF